MPEPAKTPDPAALEAAFAFLRTRDRFTAEVRNHLTSKGFEPEAIDDVVQLLVQRKLIDDKKTTQRHIERNFGKRSMGTEKLRAELERLGAPEENIELGLIALAETESNRGLEVLQTKYRSPVERAKAGRFLAGRGFAEEAIETALDVFCGSDAFPE